MVKNNRFLKFITVPFLVLSMIMPSLVVPGEKANAETQAVSVAKTVTPTTMTAGDELDVQLDIKGTPPVNVVQPNDVILVIDKSGSMSLPQYAPIDKMPYAKDAAKQFIDIMDFSAHQVGVVDFSDVSKIRTFPLTTDGTSAKQFIDTIVANGATYTGDAIRAAENALANHRSTAQPVIVLMTDGQATPTPDANSKLDALAMATEAKNKGIIFYTVALLNEGENPDTSAPNLLLKQMATTSQHHHFVLGPTGLKDIYTQIINEIGVSSAKNVVVTDTVSPEFEIVPGSYSQNIPQPTVSGNTLTWNFNELKDQTLTFHYKVRLKSSDTLGVFPISSGSKITYQDYANTSHTIDIPNQNITVTYPKPEITSITPDKGDIAGGNEVTITGKNFKSGAKVTVNSVAATNVQVVSDTEIKATVPAGTQGKAIVRVTNTDNQYAEGNYNYIANPVITAITPNEGFVEGGTNVTITGNYFVSGAKVYFNNIAAATTYVNGQKITAVTPKSDVDGTVDVKVVNPDGTEVTFPSGFTYKKHPGPTITSIDPNQGKLAGGDYVYIYGTDFGTGAKVQVGGVDAQIILQESNRIRISTPAGTAAGAVDVQVTNTDGQSAILKGGYTYLAPVTAPAPTITSVDPNQGKLAGGEYVYIYGTNFNSGATVKVGGVNAQIILQEATRIRILTPAGTAAGAVDVQVTNKDGQSATLAGGYTYLAPVVTTGPAPTITSINPNQGKLAGGDYVYIYGTDFNGAKVKVGGVDAQMILQEATRLRILTPAGTVAGAVDVQVTNTDGQTATLAGGYTYLAPVVNTAPAPTITSLSKTSGLVTGGDYVTIFGTGFQNGITATLGGKTATVANYYSDSQIRILIPQTSTEGAADLVITNPDGQSASATGAYNYLPLPKAAAPTIANISVTSGLISGGGFAYVNGTGFQNGITVTLGGVTAPVSNYYDATKIRITIPAGSTVGAADLVVTNPDAQSATLTGAYTYQPLPAIPAPTIANMSVTSGPTAGGGYVYVNGTGFQSGLTVKLGGQTATVLNYYDATKIRIIIPTTTNAGSADLQVINPDGQNAVLSNAYTYTLLVPTLSYITPTSGAFSGGNTVNIYGTNFNSNSTVTVNNVPVTITYVSASQIKISAMPAADSAGLSNAGGAVSIRVTDPAGNSVSASYTYSAKPSTAVPNISRITGAGGVAAVGSTTASTYLYLYGTGFTSGMKVRLYDSSNALVKELSLTNFYSDIYCRELMPVVTPAGTYTVKLVNVDGVESNGMAYVYK